MQERTKRLGEAYRAGYAAGVAAQGKGRSLTAHPASGLELAIQAGDAQHAKWQEGWAAGWRDAESAATQDDDLLLMHGMYGLTADEADEGYDGRDA